MSGTHALLEKSRVKSTATLPTHSPLKAFYVSVHPAPRYLVTSGIVGWRGRLIGTGGYIGEDFLLQEGCVRVPACACVRKGSEGLRSGQWPAGCIMVCFVIGVSSTPPHTHTHHCPGRFGCAVPCAWAMCTPSPWTGPISTPSSTTDGFLEFSCVPNSPRAALLQAHQGWGTLLPPSFSLMPHLALPPHIAEAASTLRRLHRPAQRRGCARLGLGPCDPADLDVGSGTVSAEEEV